MLERFRIVTDRLRIYIKMLENGAKHTKTFSNIVQSVPKTMEAKPLNGEIAIKKLQAWIHAITKYIPAKKARPSCLSSCVSARLILTDFLAS